MLVMKSTSGPIRSRNGHGEEQRGDGETGKAFGLQVQAHPMRVSRTIG